VFAAWEGVAEQDRHEESWHVFFGDVTRRSEQYDVRLIERLLMERTALMNYIPIVLSLLIGASSLALAQTAGGSSGGGPAASTTGATGASGYAGGTLSTGHTISGTAGSSDPNPGNALNHAATGSDGDASSVTQAPTSHHNAVDTPAANNAANNLGNTDTGILKK
jgi:hypothetical protein